MLLLGCRPPGRLTEQHDIFFGIAVNLKELIPAIKLSWPEAKGDIHIDAWREVNYVNGYEITVEKRSQAGNLNLFFINLGGYKKNEFDEFHFKELVVAPDLSSAIKISKQTAFYRHTGFKGATSHIDDKYGVDVDDALLVEEILPDTDKKKFMLQISENNNGQEDALNLGYLKLTRITGEE